jgi:polysaccharide chain length determinant protein (PEP-CTERM system associated)
VLKPTADGRDPIERFPVLPGKKYLPEDIVRIAWHRKWYVVVPFVIVATSTAIVSWYWPNTYRSEAVIAVVPQRVPESYVKSTVTTRTEDRLQALYQKVLSRTYLERAIQEFNLYPRERRIGIMEDVVERMRKDVTIENVKGDAFRVSYVNQDPRIAMKVADRLAGWIIDESLSDRTVLAQSTTDFLATQLEDARRRLETQEKKLADYKLAHAGELPSERESNLQAQSHLQMQVQNLVQQMAQARDRRYLLEKNIAELSVATQATPNVTISGDDPRDVAGGSTAAQLEAARQRLQALRLRYKADHPDVVTVEKVIRDLQAKAQAEALQAPLSPGAEPRPATPEEAQRLVRLKGAQTELEMVDRQIATDQTEEKRLRTVIAGYQGRVEATATRESELTSLMRDYDTLNKNYQSLLAKQEDSKVAAAMESRAIGEQFRFLDPARLPEKPVSPNRPVINLIGALAGLALGVGIVALFEYRDNSFRTDEEIVSVLSLPVIAVIPLMLSGAERRARRRRSVLVATATAVVAVGAVAAAVLFFLRYGF